MSKLEEDGKGVRPGRRDLLKLMTALPIGGLIAAAPSLTAETAADPDVSAAGQPQVGYNPQQLNPYRLKQIPTLDSLISDKKFIWADLRAFDNTAPGLGVQNI